MEEVKVEKRKRGRPLGYRKPESLRRVYKTFGLAMRPAAYEELKRRSAEAGLSMSAFLVRELGLPKD